MATNPIQSAGLRFLQKFGVAFLWATIIGLVLGAGAFFRVERRELEGEPRWHVPLRLSLEQLENLNDNFMTMVLLNQSNALLGQMTEGSALIGQSVSWLDPSTGAGGTGVVDSVKIVDGTAFLSVGGQDVALIDVTEVLGAGGTEAPAEEDGGEEA